MNIIVYDINSTNPSLLRNDVNTHDMAVTAASFFFSFWHVNVVPKQTATATRGTRTQR